MERLPDILADLTRELGMNYANFKNYDAAVLWRNEQGGHLFRTDEGDTFWFSLAYTSGVVLRHPALRGRIGTLNPHKRAVAA